MTDTEPRPWWSEVEHLREGADRRRSVSEQPDRARLATRRRPDQKSAVTSDAARRTVQIRGHTVPPPSARRLMEVERRRPARRPVDRMTSRPDRIALWAVFFGLLLVAVAAATAHVGV